MRGKLVLAGAEHASFSDTELGAEPGAGDHARADADTSASSYCSDPADHRPRDAGTRSDAEPGPDAEPLPYTDALPDAYAFPHAQAFPDAHAFPDADAVAHPHAIAHADDAGTTAEFGSPGRLTVKP